MSPESFNLNSNGRVFHNFGATTEKARSPYVFKRAVGVARSSCDDDLNIRDCVTACGEICRYFLHHRIRGLLSCVLKSFFGYFHPGVGFKAVSIKMLFKNVDIFQVFGKAEPLLMAKLVEQKLLQERTSAVSASLGILKGRYV